MRRIGGELSPDEAQRFSNYLFTIGIDAVVEESADGKQEVWARNEDHLQQARSELQAFKLAPHDSKYRVEQQAEQLRRQREKEQRDRLRLQQKFQPRAVPGVPGSGLGGQSTRMTIGIVVVCIIASLLTNFGDLPRGRSYASFDELPLSFKLFNSLSLLPIDAPEDADPSWAILKGQVWRVVTPIFLHSGMMHLVFNSLFIFFFGKVIEVLLGPRLLLGLFLAGGVLGNLAQAYGPMQFGGSPHVIGASGGALALFGFLWLRPYFEPTLPFRISTINVVFILGMVLLSMTPMAPMKNVANLAHLGGLVMGAIAAAGGLDFLRRR